MLFDSLYITILEIPAHPYSMSNFFLVIDQSHLFTTSPSLPIHSENVNIRRCCVYVFKDPPKAIRFLYIVRIACVQQS